MNNEISQEAKAAIANAQWCRARARLHRDGTESLPAMQRRIEALAAERSIPPADYAKLMYKCVSTGAVIAFCDKHNISTDRLLCGDLKGLKRMVRDREESACGRPPKVEQFMEKYHRLPREMQKIIEATVDRAIGASAIKRRRRLRTRNRERLATHARRLRR